MESGGINEDLIEFNNCYPIYSQYFCKKKVIITYPLLYLFTGIILGLLGSKYMINYFKTKDISCKKSSFTFLASTVLCFVVFMECYVEWTGLTYYQYLFFSLLSQASFYGIIDSFTNILKTFLIPGSKFFKIVQYLVGFLIVTSGIVSLVFYLYGDYFVVDPGFTTFMTNLYYVIKIWIIFLFLVVLSYMLILRKEIISVFSKKSKIITYVFLFITTLIMMYLLIYFTTIYGKMGFAQIYTVLNIKERGTSFIVFSMVSDYLFDVFTTIIIIASVSISTDYNKDSSEEKELHNEMNLIRANLL